jgi:outer membrane immunogenic protein
MKNLVLGGVAFAVLAMAPASAADAPVPVYKAAPAAVALHNWTGFYLGANAGYSWTRTGIDYRHAPGALGDFGGPFDVSGLAAAFETTPHSFIGGGQLGYNRQIGAMLFGIEADFAWRNARGSTGLTFPTFGDQLSLTSEQKWVGTVRGRLGWTPANTWLMYVTGGAAYGKVSDQLGQAVVFPPGFEGARSISSDSSKLGWTLGAGTEYAFSRAWSLGAEYLYIKLGSTSLSLPTQTINTVTYAATTADFSHSSHALRVKLNYHPNSN